MFWLYRSWVDHEIKTVQGDSNRTGRETGIRIDFPCIHVRRTAAERSLHRSLPLVDILSAFFKSCATANAPNSSSPGHWMSHKAPPALRALPERFYAHFTPPKPRALWCRKWHLPSLSVPSPKLFGVSSMGQNQVRFRGYQGLSGGTPLPTSGTRRGRKELLPSTNAFIMLAKFLLLGLHSGANITIGDWGTTMSTEAPEHPIPYVQTGFYRASEILLECGQALFRSRGRLHHLQLLEKAMGPIPQDSLSKLPTDSKLRSRLLHAPDGRLRIPKQLGSRVYQSIADVFIDAVEGNFRGGFDVGGKELGNWWMQFWNRHGAYMRREVVPRTESILDLENTARVIVTEYLDLLISSCCCWRMRRESGAPSQALEHPFFKRRV
ncbi:hypothetical protein M427DRAFT_497986 [Gonapodya prolifera JEL478]|uniref:Uncharacterized protein n=1 Tax=Gonapodya prolifera (strain JEL478) TaxID=1344416 RepID=A0A139ADC8_GONPJ|nr:hypothetical protein M427DRAFT_497986 [Gonapodya prolifera JEL478]|eukprot:KXS14777.1 hypothetical protein M427DRAFT_497986 [Gonapodya prolifera JEL478]